MALDPNFFISPNLQENFTDKDTGKPLVNGTITFFKDEDRVTPKNVFVLSGTPPNYTYVSIGNVVTLNNSGSTSNLGTDVRLYYFPFDEDGVVELYFAEVRNADTTLQFTREAWPNVFGASTSGDNGASAFTNYAPNGQFESHNDIPVAGLITTGITQIAYGNWTFERPPASTAMDNVTFTRFASYIDNPESHPRYAVKVSNSGGGGGDLFKDIRVKFNDVSEFGSDTQKFTFKFSARSLSGALDVDLVLIKNFGTGGSATTETSIENFSIGGSYSSFITSFTFGDNATQTIGPDDDDFIQLAIRLPIGTLFEAEFTNFDLREGEFAAVNFPDTTTRQTISQSLGGAFPKPDPTGLDLFLTPRLTTTGWEFDRSEIGRVIAKSVSTIDVGELLADGSSFFTNEKSADLIPFSRLQQKYFDATTQTMIHGTGLDNMTAYSPGISGTDGIMIVSNADGLVANAADGATSTGFTFTSPYVSVVTSHGINTWIESTGKTYSQSQSDGVVPLPTIQTSSVSFDLIIEGTTQTPIEFVTVYPAGASFVTGATALYWEFDVIAKAFFVWYQTGTESDPAIGGRTGIQVSVDAADTAQIVAEKTAAALSNYSASAISTIAAGGMTAGSFFTASVPTEEFYVWYTIDTAGTDPNVINRTGIQVDLLSTDDAAAVASKTQLAINTRKFAIPDYRGMFLRGATFSRTDIGLDDPALRFSRNNFKNAEIGNGRIGSEELSTGRRHLHEANSIAVSTSTINGIPNGFSGLNPVAGPGPAEFNAAPAGNPVITLNSGSVTTATTITTAIDENQNSESRPANAYVTYVIKY